MTGPGIRGIPQQLIFADSVSWELLTFIDARGKDVYKRQPWGFARASTSMSARRASSAKKQCDASGKCSKDTEVDRNSAEYLQEALGLDSCTLKHFH